MFSSRMSIEALLLVCLLFRPTQSIRSEAEDEPPEPTLDMLGIPMPKLRDLIDMTDSKAAKSMLSEFKEAERTLRDAGMERDQVRMYHNIILENEDVLDRAQAFAHDANELGIPVGFSAQPAFGFFWELVNMVASKFATRQDEETLSQATSRAFPEGTSKLLESHGFNFADSILMRTRAELETKGVLSLNAVPEYVDWLNFDESTNRQTPPTEQDWASAYNGAWVSASANMKQVAKMESALYFMRRTSSGGGSPILYRAMHGYEGRETAVSLGMHFAEFIVGPSGDYPVSPEIQQELSRRLAELWIKLASDAAAKVLHVILIAPQSASSHAYLSQAFAWLSRKMVHPSLHSGLSNRMRLEKRDLLDNDQFVEVLKQLNENPKGRWSFYDDQQLRIRPPTRLGPGEGQELPGTASFPFYQHPEDEKMFHDWSRQISQVFEDVKASR